MTSQALAGNVEDYPLAGSSDDVHLLNGYLFLVNSEDYVSGAAHITGIGNRDIDGYLLTDICLRRGYRQQARHKRGWAPVCHDCEWREMTDL